MKTSGVARLALPVAALLLAFLIPAIASAQDDGSDSLPETTRGAIQVYEEDVDIDEWAEGPVEYIMLDYEHEIWDALEVELEKEAFREWFWGRRDLDPRDEDHERMEDFYERVAHANQRFNDFPRGWRSDRGRVWITLGRPAGMRQQSLARYGRCSTREGEVWTYYTSNMAFASNFGEFYVVFVQPRIGQYEICDPTMAGIGAFPTELRRAFEYTREAMIVDTVTEFDVTLDMARRSAGALPVREVEGSVSPLEVPLENWGAVGAAGTLVVPVEIPLSGLLFEPVGNELVATLDVEAALVGMGEDSGQSGQQQWKVRLDAESGREIGSARLRTALVLPSEPGAYAATVRVTDPLSGEVRVWENAVEVQEGGVAVSPPLVGRNLLQLREAGEVAVLGGGLPELESGEAFAVVSWVRGLAVDADSVTLTLVDSDGNASAVEGIQVAWGNQASAGPLLVEAVLPELSPGRYVLQLRVAADLGPVETVVEVR